MGISCIVRVELLLFSSGYRSKGIKLLFSEKKNMPLFKGSVSLKAEED